MTSIMCSIWILFGSILLFFANVNFKNNTIFPIGYLSQCELPPAIMTGQTPISIQYNRNNLFIIRKSTNSKLDPHILKTVKQLGNPKHNYNGARAGYAQVRHFSS